MLDDTFTKLKDHALKDSALTLAPQERQIMGVPNYDILQNPDYISAFQYVPTDVDRRNEIIIDNDEDSTNNVMQSDCIRLYLNVAMMEKEAGGKDGGRDDRK